MTICRHNNNTGNNNNNNHVFVPVAIETVGTWNHLAMELTQELGRRLPVPAAVSGSTTGECGLLPQHFHHRVNVAVLTLLTLQYLLPTGFVLVG